MAIRMHYFRGGRQVSPRPGSVGFHRVKGRAAGLRLAVAAGLALGVGAAMAQYPGQIKKSAKDVPDLRAVAVLEWTGEVGKPKTSRIIPVTIFDGEKLQDAGIYLARPQPLALSGEVEYQLEQNGKPFGLFDVKNAGQEQGSWVGFGTWKAMPKPKPVQGAAPPKIDDIEEDKPVLHRKKHSGEGGSADGGDKKGSDAGKGTADPDRPTLHKKTTDDSSAGAGGGSGAAPPADPGRPTLHKHAGDDDKAAGQTQGGSSGSSSTDKSSSSDAQASPDADRPTLKKGKPKPPEDVGHVDSVRDQTDPDRPRLKRGKSSDVAGELVPTLMGMPADMQQTVAVSDAKTRPEHPWSFSWANPEDEGKMKAQVEAIAREALGIAAPEPAPVPKRSATRPGAATRPGTTTHKTAKAAAPPAEPSPLEDEEFRVFELAYGSGATMVLTAHSSGPLAAQKFVTIVAQPDLYGNVRVVLKSVTDMAHLDETPRMRLVDAVDAMADNRGELLFELRGDGSRQFALFRIYRGTAEKMFVSGGGVYGTVSSE